MPRKESAGPVDLEQVLSNLAQVSEQVKRSAHGPRAHAGVQQCGTAAAAGRTGVTAGGGGAGAAGAWTPRGGGAAGLGLVLGGGGGAAGAEGKLQQYKQQLHVLQDTLLQSAQSEFDGGLVWPCVWASEMRSPG